MNNRAAVVAELMRIAATRTTAQWLDLLGPLGVPCGPINDMAQTFAHPQVRHRGMQFDMPHPAAGTVPLVANPIRFARQPIGYDRPPPLLGQHTDELLGELLGLDGEAIGELRRGRVV